MDNTLLHITSMAQYSLYHFVIVILCVLYLLYINCVFPSFGKVSPA